MKLFETVQKNLAIVGITSTAQPLNFVKIFLTSLCIWSVCISSWLFFAYEAKSFIEYTISMYNASGTNVSAIYFMIIIVQTQNIFKFIDRCEKIIENGKKIVIKIYL